MSKNTQIGELINYISVNESGNVVLSTGQLVATQNYVGTAISNLVDSSPATLDTLNELAAALGDDPNFATTVATSIGTKQAQLNGTGFVKVTGTTVSYDNSTYLTTDTGSSTYVPYTGASGNVSLGNYELGAKYVIAEGSAGLGGVISIRQDAAYLAKGNGYSSIASSFTEFDFFGYTGASTYKNFTLKFDGLTNNTRRRYTLPDSDGTLALTSDIPSVSGVYLPLAGGIMSGDISYGVGNSVSWYLQPQAVGGGPSNGPVLRLRSHSGAGALSDRSGALAWIDGNGVRLDLFEWNSSLINAYVPINGTSAVFSSTVAATGLTTGTTGGSTISITTSNNAGITGTPLQTKLNFLGYNGNINGQIRVDDISSTAQVGSMQFYTWNSAQVLALTLAHTGAATFTGVVNTAGLLTGQASIYQSDAGGLIASNRWSVYNGGATTMRFLYNGSGDVIFDNGAPRLTLSSTGAATFSSTLQANGGNITSFSSVGVAGFGNGINIHTQAGTYTSGHGGILQFQNEDVITGGIRGIRDGGSWGGSLLFYTHNTSAGNTFNSTFVEGMRLTSNGNLLLGTVSDGVYRLDVQQGASNAAKFNFAVTGVWGGGANQDHGMLISGARHTSDTNTSLLHILNTDATSLFRVTDYGKVGINTFTPTATLDINGDVRYRGSIYDSFNFVASGNYTAGTYYNIVGVNIIPTGIYIIEGQVDTFAAGGGIYFVRFASVPFFMWDVGSNSTTFVDLPPVLGTGHHLGNQFPSFRLQMTLGGAGIYLQFTPNSTWAGIDNSGGKSFRVNLKRIG
jgi:hypothetical protein